MSRLRFAYTLICTTGIVLCGIDVLPLVWRQVSPFASIGVASALALMALGQWLQAAGFEWRAPRELGEE